MRTLLCLAALLAVPAQLNIKIDWQKGHGDDFAAVGSKTALDAYEAGPMKCYEVTVAPRIGPGLDDAKEVRVINRIIRWTKAGVEYEADSRQSERFVAMVLGG